MGNRKMYAISISSEESGNNIARELAHGRELYPMINLINIIFSQLRFIKSQTPSGFILNEIIERTEVVAFNIKNNDLSVLTPGYIKDYQKNLWQLLSDLNEAELSNGRTSNLDEQRAIFYDLFTYLDDIIEERSCGKNSMTYEASRFYQSTTV